VLTTDGTRTLVDVIIANSICVNLVSQTTSSQRVPATITAQLKHKSLVKA